MREFLVYEHVYGLPDYLDTVNEELTECIIDVCFNITFTEKQLENYVNDINNINPTDKYGRKRNLYVHWCN